MLNGMKYNVLIVIDCRDKFFKFNTVFSPVKKCDNEDKK